MRPTLLAVLLLLCAAVASAGAPPRLPLVGTWNGAHVSIELTAAGGTVEFDCAHGEIDAPLVPDGDGRFDLPGRYMEEHGGPVRADTQDATVEVRYSGQVTSGRMKLTITRRDTGQRLGSFTLSRGGDSMVVKCR